jgi:hypothetical protein
MPRHQTGISELNQSFGSKGIGRLAAHSEAFAPGKKLGSGLFITKDSPLYGEYQAYLAALPGSIQETIRSVLYYALTAKDAKGKSKPIQVTMAWMPGYDFKVTVVEVGDTTQSPGGITLLLETPYDKKTLLSRATPPAPAKPAPKRPKRPK